MVLTGGSDDGIAVWCCQFWRSRDESDLCLGIVHYSVAATFWTLGIVYLIVVVASAQFYANPPQGWRPVGWEPRTAVAKSASTIDFTVGQALGAWQFYLLFLLLFLNVSAGIMTVLRQVLYGAGNGRDDGAEGG